MSNLMDSCSVSNLTYFSFALSFAFSFAKLALLLILDMGHLLPSNKREEGSECQQRGKLHDILSWDLLNNAAPLNIEKVRGKFHVEEER